MNKKNLFLSLALILALAALAGYTAPLASAAAESGAVPEASFIVQEEKTFTLEELAVFNGKNGQPAYIAVDGVVYDVTNGKGWKEGEHNGFAAGADITEAIMAAPHGVGTLKDLPIIGKLADPANAGLVLALEELAAFDGKDGRPAYIAVDGIVYDVTDSAFWKGGAHNGFAAGKDLTDEIKTKSPHGVAMLERVPVVGEIKK